MRITNPMMTNQLLLNINRNMRRLNTLYMQESSGKKIQYPSEDPIIAGRALKFRTALADTEQFQKNVKQGLSWMQVTQGSFQNVVSIMETIYDRVMTGASDLSGTWQDRQKMVTEIEGLVAQLGTEMNVTYAGRYVFSGLRTDMPPIYENDNTDSYKINQYFTAKDVLNTSAVQKVFNINTVTAAAGDAVASVNGTAIGALNVVNKTLQELDTFNPPANTIHYIADTGQYVFGSNFPPNSAVTFMTSPPTTTSTVVKETAPPIVNNANIIKLPYVGMDASQITFNVYNGTPPRPSPLTRQFNGVIQKSISDPSAYTPGPTETYYIPETGELVLGSDMARTMANLAPGASLVVNYQKDGFAKGEPNPKVYFDCADLKANPVKTYTMDNQSLQFEFGTNSRMAINSLAKDVITDKMYAELKDFCQFVKDASLSDPSKLETEYRTAYPTATADEINEMVNDQIAKEKQLYETVLRTRFSDMIGKVQGYSSSISLQETDAGVRINRLELISDRLVQDRDTYRELMSENEDVDYMEIIMELSSAQSLYQASLMTGANMIKLSLADYLR